MTKLIFVRHGYSEANKSHVFAGCTFDAPLSEQGKAQGDAVSSFIAQNFLVDRIVSSPMIRAQSTVKLLSEKTGKQIETDEKFREIYGGEWEGKTFSDIEKIYPEEYVLWRTDFGYCRPVGGESFEELRERVVNAARRLAEESDGKTVVVATHAGAIRALLAGVKNLTDEEIKQTTWVPNASISVLAYENGTWTVEIEGFADYLGENKTVLPPNI